MARQLDRPVGIHDVSLVARPAGGHLLNELHELYAVAVNLDVLFSAILIPSEDRFVIDATRK